MRERRTSLASLFLVSALASAVGPACGGGTPSSEPADAGDGGDDAGPPDAAPDGAPPIDGAPGDGPDTTPPSVTAVAPAAGTAVWLHEPIRVVFDEPIAAGDAAVAVTLDGAAVTAAVALEGDRTLAVRLPAELRGVGPLAIHIDGVADLAGNMIAAPIDLAHDVPAWSRPAVDRGPAASSPALAVDDGGAVTAVWLVGAAGARRVVVSRHEHGAWQALGGTLGANDASSPAVALDDTGAPLAAWIEAGVAHVSRWDGAAWIALPSPGSGAQLALAAPPGGTAGAPVVAVAGSSGTVTVAELTAGAWQPLGAPLAITGTLTGELAVATPGAGRAAVGWIDTAGGAPRVRVHRFASASWTALAPIALGAAPGVDRMSLAARDQTIAVAWDQWGGSFGVYAAIATGAATAWTRLGRTLDVDVAGDAVAPAIALDASAAPIVAWRERIEGAERGAIARWSGSAWTVVGGPTWLAAATGATTRATIALHAGRAPVIGTSGGGAIAVARFNGPATGGPGMVRAPLTGCTFSAAAPPPRALLTGCFTLASPGVPVPHAGLVPYDIVTELWSDGTKKRRWLALPNNSGLTATANGSWIPPVGGFAIKEFAIETTPGDPSTRRAVETRFFVRTATGFEGFSYRWRLDGTDADLLTDGQWTYDWPLAGGGTYRHVYPSRSHCLSCHHTSMGPLLGVRGPQLARLYDYSGTIADQLATLSAIGVAPAASATPWIAAHDPQATAAERVRGYMAANCAHCHNPDAIAIKDLRYTTPLAQTRLCEVIVPGSPAQSNVYQRVTSRPGMPALGTLAVDPLADQLFGTWITGMTSCP